MKTKILILISLIVAFKGFTEEKNESLKRFTNFKVESEETIEQRYGFQKITEIKINKDFSSSIIELDRDKSGDFEDFEQIFMRKEKTMGLYQKSLQKASIDFSIGAFLLL